MRNIKIIILLLISTIGYTQAPVVSVPKAEILLSKILKLDIQKNGTDKGFQTFIKALQENGLEINEETMNGIKKIHEGLEIVNDVIKTGKNVSDIKDLTEQISNLYFEANININKHPYISTYDKEVCFEANNILMANVYESGKELMLYLKDNKLKLSDFERHTLIENVKKEIQSSYNQMNFIYKSYIHEGNLLENKLRVIKIFKKNEN